MVTISVVASPPWAGRVCGVEVLQQCTEGLAEESVVGDPVFLTTDRVVVLPG